MIITKNMVKAEIDPKQLTPKAQADRYIFDRLFAVK
jgi:hypothetical protein